MEQIISFLPFPLVCNVALSRFCIKYVNDVSEIHSHRGSFNQYIEQRYIMSVFDFFIYLFLQKEEEKKNLPSLVETFVYFCMVQMCFVHREAP